jgi:flagellar hook-length control protein FliK
MLAMMLPATATTNSPTAKDETSPQVPTPDGGSALSGDMIAMMLPATAGMSSPVANRKGLQEPITNGGKKAQTQPIATAELGATLQSAESKNKATSGVSGETSALLGAQGNAKPESAATGNTSKDNTFAAALETLSKDGAKTAQLDASATKIFAQPVTPTAPDSLLQSAIAPIAVSQSGVTQATQAVINTPVTDQAWGNEFNQKITWMASQHEQTAELHLNPPNLGPLDVVLKVSGDQATALFTSPHAAVRDAVQQALPQLRDMLAGNGITLGNATVSDQSPKDQQAWQANQQQKGNGGSAGKIDATVATGGITTSGSAVSLGSRHQGMVDTFA